MKRISAIFEHPEFAGSLEKTLRLEKDRKFCGHGLEHLLDVSRIAYILSLEAGESIEKELIYAAGLLHDIGRWRQYVDDTPHEIESAAIASRILPDCGFDAEETSLILEAILSHRTKFGDKPGFSGFIYKADKLSRKCFECAAADECNWAIKNMRLEY